MIEYRAKIMGEHGDSYNCELYGFREFKMKHKNLWARMLYPGKKAEVKGFDYGVSDNDLYKLGYYKILNVTKVEIIERQTKIYSI